MACLSPSPSGRRLSELLEEKQEPFFLDLHLLEKGCASSRLLDGYDTTTAMCWPTAAAGNDASAVLRRLTSKKTKAATTAGGSKHKKQQQQKPAGGLLQLLLSKILRGSRAAAQRKPAALQFSDSFKLAAVAPAPCSGSASDSDSDRDCHMELDAVKTVADADAKAQDANAGRYNDNDDSDDEKQQLSPVSVLDHPFETSPVHGHGKLLLSPSSKGGPTAAMDVFRDLLDAAYSPALLAQLLARSEDLLYRDTADEDDDCSYFGGYRTSPKNCRDDESAAAYWDAHREELARVSELVASELPTSKLSAADVQPERRDVGAEVEAAVFEALLQELVVDLGSGSGC